ncbi:hypothetical protein [Erythrobacter crassostreae]|uniref:Uncharacterized protein n=1 Tax=Erythrobacter crassostreae TaxID=2828328 RepID=A0A9X1F2F5_9SPHN|nr:hypothetical protein [Erythrobacter crassostrea]MBV7258756.1 hypothetical protein [Erythrobacter crassostrea]
MRAIRQRIANFRSSKEAGEDAVETPDTPAETRAKKPSIAILRGFVPLIGAWGALLGALCVIVLPTSTVLRMAMATGLSGLGNAATYVFAALAALIVGGIAAAGAIAFKRREFGPAEAEWDDSTLVEGLEPIDPTAELGSDSLDAPIDVEPFSAAEIDHDFETGAEPLELMEEALDLDSDQISEAEFKEELEKPRELALAEFGEISGRDGVWVEEVSDEIEDNDNLPEVDDWSAWVDPDVERTVEPSIEAPLAAQIAPSAKTALEKLRQAPVEELSLVHMVERFAAALHDHQDAERKRPGSLRSPDKDASLASALKALTLFTEDGFDADLELTDANADALRDTTRDLRDALAKLQDLRGAA